MFNQHIKPSTFLKCWMESNKIGFVRQRLLVVVVIIKHNRTFISVPITMCKTSGWFKGVGESKHYQYESVKCDALPVVLDLHISVQLKLPAFTSSPQYHIPHLHGLSMLKCRSQFIGWHPEGNDNLLPMHSHFTTFSCCTKSSSQLLEVKWDKYVLYKSYGCDVTFG